jgi:purine-binding chemotaxis protein CheW
MERRMFPPIPEPTSKARFDWSEQMVNGNDNAGETQLVVFDLASEYYGVDIGDVREIIRMQNVTRVPGTPAYMEGVTNLRGKVVPVVDLRKRLDLKVKAQTKESRIVVVDIGGKDVGVIVDGVTEVLRIPLASVEPPSQMVADSERGYIRGIAKLEDKLVILLDLDRVMGEQLSESKELLSLAEPEEKSRNIKTRERQPALAA